jgi:small subunit ribosomal protein S20
LTNANYALHLKRFLLQDLTMANHPSALKRHIQSLKKNARNRSARAALATQVKKARLDLKNNDEVTKAVSILARSARKGIIPKKTMSRRISRLMKQAHAVNARS